MTPDPCPGTGPVGDLTLHGHAVTCTTCGRAVHLAAYGQHGHICTTCHRGGSR